MLRGTLPVRIISMTLSRISMCMHEAIVTYAPMMCVLNAYTATLVSALGPWH